MIITYFGKQFFKINQGEMVLAFNPVSKDSKSGISAKFGADIALVTTNHPDYNGVDQLSYGERMPFIVSGPGDYEVKSIFINGGMSEFQLNDKKYINTVYSLTIDGINIVFLGALSNANLSKEARGLAESPDILFVPIGGESLLSAKDAAKFSASLEAKLVIPMDYDKNSLQIFLKEMGEENAEVVDKITLKRKDLDGSEGKVVVLKAV
ncbi:MAG: MBL fold metallo-hydrolase [Candidatus Pacebacteria bacterium]|nr:MBL fold metallo-hydrolase [Candidatus Paceibacterota bacterium]MCF7862984.1 MBL fold metallo-hydrolase [Candidatus Paceibacterota bacterium]